MSRPLHALPPVPVLLVTLLSLLVSACGGPSGAADETTTEQGRVAPALADVEADTLADPRDWEGPASALVAAGGLDPVDPGPQQLPVTLTDAQGTEVTVEDTSRVLALDVYGTLSRTVWELGMGESLVGRDISTQFAEAADLPLVTQNGHDLNAEAILELDPTLILTDTSLGPWDVVLQMRDAGVPVVVVDSHRGLDNISSLTQEVAEALGVPDAGTAPTSASGCAPSSSTCGASRGSTTSSARAAAPTRSSTRSAATTWPRRSAGTA